MLYVTHFSSSFDSSFIYRKRFRYLTRHTLVWVSGFEAYAILLSYDIVVSVKKWKQFFFSETMISIENKTVNGLSSSSPFISEGFKHEWNYKNFINMSMKPQVLIRMQHISFFLRIVSNLDAQPQRLLISEKPVTYTFFA